MDTSNAVGVMMNVMFTKKALKKPGINLRTLSMDLKSRIDEIQARIDAMRKMIDKSDSDNYSEPEIKVKEQLKPKPSAADDLKAKLMKKK